MMLNNIKKCSRLCSIPEHKLSEIVLVFVCFVFFLTLRHSLIVSKCM